MAKKKQINEIRTDYLENWIGFYRAYGRKDWEHALIQVARDIGAPIEAEAVDRMEKLHSVNASFIEERM